MDYNAGKRANTVYLHSLPTGAWEGALEEHCMNIVSNHRDPLHVSETVLSCNTQWKFNVHV